MSEAPSKDRRLRDLPVRHLDWVFHPPGLPLPDRGFDAAPTTSVLVRGAAGTGKTSLALGVAAGLTEALGGRIYYLSTEIAPTDVRFKLGQVGLPEGAAAGRARATPETKVVVEHLLRVAEPEPKAGWRTDAALRHIEGIVADAAIDDLRVIVVDAFSLLGETEARSSLRLELAEFIQACDTRGISVVLVEEAPGASAAFLPFVVDVVFELGWGEDPDTHGRYRQLSVTKSRFAPAANGPHDYGLEQGRLAVWPELGSVDLEALRTFVRGGRGDVEFLGPNGSIVYGLAASNMDVSSGIVFGLAETSPWARRVLVALGGSNNIDGVVLRTADGPNAVLWAVLNSSVNGERGIVFMMGLDAVDQRARYNHPFFGGASVLAAVGLFVILYASEREILRLPVTLHYSEDIRGSQRYPESDSLGRIVGWPFLVQKRISDLILEVRKRKMAQSLTLEWALLHAIILSQTEPLDWALTQTIPPTLEPLVRHALARNGRMEDAIARLATFSQADQALLTAELHLNQFTAEGLAAATPVYERMLADRATPAEDRKLLSAQLAEVRAALANA